MNHIGEWKTIVRTNDHARSEIWRGIFGINVAPIKTVIPQLVDLPGRPGILCYILDVQAMDDGQKEKLLQYLSKEANEPVEDIRERVMNGVPIISEEVTVESTDQEEIFALMQVVGEIEYADPFICGECGNPREFCSCDDRPEDWGRYDEV